MNTFPLPPLGDQSQEEYLADLERIIEKLGLTIRTRGTLKQFPDSIHWHIVKEGKKGTLEFTLTVEESRPWLSVHDNRMGDWNLDAVEKIQRSMAG